VVSRPCGVLADIIRDEAFELGLQWAGLYPEGSPSRALIEEVMSTSYLVNIVANDFKDGTSIFAPFVLDQAVPAAANGVNGVNGSHAVAEKANGVLESVANGVKSAVEVVKGASASVNGH
jgi:methylenetetrahydrofolate reductase (NADPH)